MFFANSSVYPLISIQILNSHQLFNVYHLTHVNLQGYTFFFTADVNDSGQCSIARKGIYAYQDKTFDCSGTVNIGCQTPNEIIVETTCSKDADQFRKGKCDVLQIFHPGIVSFLHVSIGRVILSVKRLKELQSHLAFSILFYFHQENMSVKIIPP